MYVNTTNEDPFVFENEKPDAHEVEAEQITEPKTEVKKTDMPENRIDFQLLLVLIAMGIIVMLVILLRKKKK